MITHFDIITFTLNYVINFEFQNSFNCLALKVIYIHFLNSICLNYAQLVYCALCKQFGSDLHISSESNSHSN